MITHPVEFECDAESEDLFKRIEELRPLMKACHIDWGEITYFAAEEFWRFDWGYIWNWHGTELVPLLKQAVEFAEDWIKPTAKVPDVGFFAEQFGNPKEEK